MSQNFDKYPLQRCSENEKIAYLSILASICYVDGEFSECERQQLNAFLNDFNISSEGKREICSSIFNLSEKNKINYLNIIRNICDTDLNFTLVSDMCLLALSDSNFSIKEYNYVMEIGENLGITHEQVEAIRTVQENLYKIKDIPSKSKAFKKIIKECVSKLAGAGVPIGAIAVSGSVFGLSAAGLTSGLAALGALVGGGMLAGTVFVVPAIAAGSVYGVKKLFDVIWKDKEE
jgi:uncharacterized tellurite resistance protein B-like protein